MCRLKGIYCLLPMVCLLAVGCGKKDTKSKSTTPTSTTTTTSTPTPTPTATTSTLPTTPGKVMKVVTGRNFSIILGDNGTLWGFGDNQNAELGLGTRSVSGTGVKTPTLIGTATDWVDMTAYHEDGGVLAINSKGELWGWGKNYYGELGIGECGVGKTGLPILKPQLVATAPGKKWAAVSAGARHAVALATDGTLWSWGYDGTDNDASYPRGRLGRAIANPQDCGLAHNFFDPTPAQVGTATDWIKISAGTNHTLGIRAVGTAGGGTLWGFGQNGSSCALGAIDSSCGGAYTEPTAIYNNADTDWIAIAAGFDQTLAIKADHTLWTVGGSAGYGSANGAGSLSQVGSAVNVATGATSTWIGVIAGFETSFALKDDGSLWAFGANIYGFMGAGTTDNQAHYTVTRVGTGTYTAVAAYTHALAINVDGKLWSWGQGTAVGELGRDYTAISAATPTQVTLP